MTEEWGKPEIKETIVKEKIEDKEQIVKEDISDIVSSAVLRSVASDLLAEHKAVLKVCYDIIKTGNKPCVSVGRLSEVAGISEELVLWHLKMMEADSLGVFFDDGCESFCFKYAFNQLYGLLFGASE